MHSVIHSLALTDWLSLLRIVCLKNRVVQNSEFNLGVSGSLSGSRDVTRRRPATFLLPCPLHRFRFPRDRYPPQDHVPSLYKKSRKMETTVIPPSFFRRIIIIRYFFHSTAFFISSNWYFIFRSISRNHSLLLKNKMFLFRNNNGL